MASEFAKKIAEQAAQLIYNHSGCDVDQSRYKVKELPCFIDELLTSHGINPETMKPVEKPQGLTAADMPEGYKNLPAVCEELGLRLEWRPEACHNGLKGLNVRLGNDLVLLAWCNIGEFHFLDKQGFPCGQGPEIEAALRERFGKPDHHTNVAEAVIDAGELTKTSFVESIRQAAVANSDEDKNALAAIEEAKRIPDWELRRWQVFMEVLPYFTAEYKEEFVVVRAKEIADAAVEAFRKG